MCLIELAHAAWLNVQAPAAPAVAPRQTAMPAAPAGASAFARTLVEPPPALPNGRPQPGGVCFTICMLCSITVCSGTVRPMISHDRRVMTAFVDAGNAVRKGEAAQAVLASRSAQPEYDDELVDEIFGFDSPSPDDVVLAARAQATGRPAASPAAPAAPKSTTAAVPAPAGSSAPGAQAQQQPARLKQPAKSAKAAPGRPFAPPPKPTVPAEPSTADAAAGGASRTGPCHCML